MTSSYEQRIVEAMLRRSEALEHGDDNAAAEALVEAGKAADAIREQRRDTGLSADELVPHQEYVSLGELWGRDRNAAIYRNEHGDDCVYITDEGGGFDLAYFDASHDQWIELVTRLIELASWSHRSELKP